MSRSSQKRLDDIVERIAAAKRAEQPGAARDPLTCDDVLGTPATDVHPSDLDG